MENVLAPIIGVVIGILFISFLFIYLPVKMARKRGRSAIGWILICWLITPFWGLILLSILGDSRDKIKQDILNELKQ